MHGRTDNPSTVCNFPILFKNSLWSVFRIRILYFSFHSFSLIGSESRSISSKRQKSREIQFIQMKCSGFRVWMFFFFFFAVCCVLWLMSFVHFLLQMTLRYWNKSLNFAEWWKWRLNHRLKTRPIFSKMPNFNNCIQKNMQKMATATTTNK